MFKKSTLKKSILKKSQLYNRIVNQAIHIILNSALRNINDSFIIRRALTRMICSRTGWRRLIGSPKLQIIFHKRATKYRSLLPKMTYKDKGSYESSPPCRVIQHIS